MILKRFEMKINGVDGISVEESEDLFQLRTQICDPNKTEHIELLLTRDELVELKAKLDMLIEFTR